MLDVRAKFQKQFDTAVSSIETFLKDEYNIGNGLSELVEWLLTSNSRVCHAFPSVYVESLESAENFVMFLNNLQHYFEEDSLEFVTILGSPRMVFANKYDEDFYKQCLSPMQRAIEEYCKDINWEEEYQIEVLDISVKEFPALYETYWRVENDCIY